MKQKNVGSMERRFPPSSRSGTCRLGIGCVGSFHRISGRKGGKNREVEKRSRISAAATTRGGGRGTEREGVRVLTRDRFITKLADPLLVCSSFFPILQFELPADSSAQVPVVELFEIETSDRSTAVYTRADLLLPRSTHRRPHRPRTPRGRSFVAAEVSGYETKRKRFFSEMLGLASRREEREGERTGG